MRQINIKNLLKTIGLSPSFMAFMRGSNKSDIEHGLREFKELVRTKRKELAKIHHPDKGGDAERMKAINDACDMLVSIKLQFRPPPAVRYYHFNVRTYGGTTATDTSTTTWTTL